VLYVRRGIKLSPQLVGGGQERGVRSGTENVLLAGAFAVALEDAQKHAATNTKKIARVRDALLKDICKRIPGVELNGAAGEERVANNLNISIPYLDGQMAVIALSREGVAASTRSACDASSEAPSHVLSALYLSPERIQTAIRLTLLPTATAAQAKVIAKKLADIAKRYQNMA
jgi:cysteine desulfurase